MTITESVKQGESAVAAPFLKQVARYYREVGQISGKCFIFPNRRSMVFFRKYLTEIPADIPFVMPELLTINDFFSKASNRVTSDRVRLLIELYQCYKKLNKLAEPLDEFIFWGDVILGDFNDVDKYLADPEKLFANVADFKAIQDTYEYLTDTQRKALESFVNHFNDISGKLTVNIDSDNPSVKARFLQIWNILYKLYKDYNKVLAEKNMAYEGMAYRTLAERFVKESAPEVLKEVFPSVDTFVFIGLNALNECEKTVLRKLRDAGMAEFCWDYTGDMISNPQNRSSLFMGNNVKEFPQVSQWDRNGVGTPKVSVLSVPSSYGQAKRLPDILKSIADSQLGGDLPGICKLGGNAPTAIILPDESLLTPVLNSIPSEIKDVNVTMGLPMTGSAVHTFMLSVSANQLHLTEKGGKWYFYHKTVWGLFSTAVFKKSADAETLKVVDMVRKQAKYYIPVEDLNKTPLLEILFQPVLKDLKLASSEQNKAFAEYQKSVLAAFAKRMSADTDLALELEYAKEYYKSINILEDIDLDVLPVTYVRLLGQLLCSVSVHFKGEPLKGLQVMGPLEVRALDFRNLIIMSSNEGVFPRRSVSSSFIPPELRKGFGLPTYEYQDAVWAYYFYRMISRAENVYMLVDSRAEGLKSGEESRYIKQLEYHFGLHLDRYVVKSGASPTYNLPDIVKTQEDVECIKNMTFSATSFQNYLDCPVKFYYYSIKKLKSEEEVAENLDGSMFGNIYHELMHSIYSSPEAMNPDFFFNDKRDDNKLSIQYLDKIDKEYIKGWLDKKEIIRNKVNALIMNELNVMEVTGRNLVVADVIVRYVMQTLSRDLEILQAEGTDSFKILGREQKVFGKIHNQKFIGFIDRLDSFRDGVVRIVDYKTGKVLDDDYVNVADSPKANDKVESIVNAIFDISSKERPKIAFQFYIYDMLSASLDCVKGRQVRNCIYSTTGLFRDVPVSVELNKLFIDRVTGRLGETFEQMYDINVPFIRTSDEKVCSFCDFKSICGR